MANWCENIYGTLIKKKISKYFKTPFFWATWCGLAVRWAAQIAMGSLVSGFFRSQRTKSKEASGS